MSPSKSPFGVSPNWTPAPIDDPDLSILLELLFSAPAPAGGAR